jgi:FkbM family methyltransferase
MSRVKRIYWSLLNKYWQPLHRRRRLRSELGWSAVEWERLRDETDDTIRLPVRGLEEPVLLRRDTSDIDVFEDVFLDGAYSAPQLSHVRSIVDCGANVGLASLYFLRAYPAARIVAVEPDPENVTAARKNLAAYHNRATLLAAAVWPSTGAVTVHRGDYRDGRHWSSQVSIDATKGERVRAITIDEILDTHGIAQLDILKIDIEGAEKALFQGNTEFLNRTRCILIELHDDDVPGCAAAFYSAIKPYGFQVRGQNLTTIATR